MVRDFFITATRKIEERLGIDLGYYLRGNAYLLFAQGVILLCGLASSIVLARLLPKETYGQYNYIFSVIAILAISALPGMNAAIMHAVANKHDRTFIQGTQTRLRWSLLGALACLVVGVYYYFTGETLLGKSFMGVSILFPLYKSLEGFYPFLNGRKRFGLSSLNRSIYWICLTSAVILAVYLTKNLLWIVIVYLATASMLEAVFFFNTVRTGNLNQSGDKGAITYGKHLTGIQAMGLVALQFDKLIIGIALGYEELAAYSIALMIANLPSVLITSITITIFPKMAAMDERIAYNEVKRRLPLLMIGLVIVCGIGALLAPYVIPWFYSQRYLDSVFYTQLLFIPIILGAPGEVLRRGVLQARRKTRELFKLNIVVYLFEMAMMVLFALKFGVIGIVVARALAKAFDSAYAWKLTA